MLYLIKTKGKGAKKSAAHYWNEKTQDTLCTMSSTGGLFIENYNVFDTKGTKRVCEMCNTLMIKKVQKAFSSIHQLDSL